MDDDHALAPFLESRRLAKVGLDVETYGHYVLPLLTDSECISELAHNNSKTDSHSQSIFTPH